MARVTVEDCLAHLGNQFELTMVATKRARQLARGANTALPWEGDKTTVMALREIADGYVDAGILSEVDLPPIPTGQDTPKPPEDEIAEEAVAEDEEAGKPKREGPPSED